MSALELLRLERLPGVGPVAVRRLVARFGSAGAALRAPAAAFAKVAGREAADARRDRVRAAEAARTLEVAERRGISVLTWDDVGYPAALGHLADPPPLLFLSGRVELLGRTPTVTIVGARRSTARAREISERLAAALARAGATVASGLALGVDGAAHAGALRAGGDTLAVLGASVDVPYPRHHRRLHERIAKDGLLVSEFPPGTAAAPHHFPRRNRVLAALAGTVVVVEAGRRSGALITVDHALDLGREVWAVPGPIDIPACEGSNRMLVDGARPLVSIDAFVGHVAGSVPRAPRRARTPESELEARILERLRGASLRADELAALSDVPIASVLAVLTTLELHGEVERVAGMRYRSAA